MDPNACPVTHIHAHAHVHSHAHALTVNFSPIHAALALPTITPRTLPTIKCSTHTRARLAHFAPARLIRGPSDAAAARSPLRSSPASEESFAPEIPGCVDSSPPSLFPRSSAAVEGSRPMGICDDRPCASGPWPPRSRRLDGKHACGLHRVQRLRSSQSSAPTVRATAGAWYASTTIHKRRIRPLTAYAPACSNGFMSGRQAAGTPSLRAVCPWSAGRRGSTPDGGRGGKKNGVVTSTGTKIIRLGPAWPPHHRAGRVTVTASARQAS